jgi:hypothetical protein
MPHAAISLPEHVITRKVRFEDAHEAIGDPTTVSPSFAMVLNRMSR